MTTVIMDTHQETRHKVAGEYVYDGVVFSEGVSLAAVEKISDFNMEGDILVTGYPKTGTTWIQEMVWLVQNDGDIETATKISTEERIYLLEHHYSQYGKSALEVVGNPPHQREPRVFKSHLYTKYFQKHLEQQNVKIILLIRNPKDTLVSLYHFYQMNAHLGNFKGSWDEYFELYKEKHLIYGDYTDLYTGWVKHKTNTKLFVITYEDMKRNLTGELRRMATFLGKDLSDEVIAKIASYGTFEKMSENKTTNYSYVPKHIFKDDVSKFMRKGQVGDWKNYFTAEQSRFVDMRCAALFEEGFKVDFE